MLSPLLPSGIEQTNSLTRHRVEGINLVIFEVVAVTAREPKVFFCIGATGSPRNNMVDL
jgi:hypothetical protein